MGAKENPTQVSLRALIDLREAANGLRLGSRRIRTRLAGQYQAPAKGRGMEFAESRPYQPGDDVRTIDWRVTARSGTTHTKLYQEERERPVLIAVDNRAGMFFATRGRFKSVIAAEVAALLAWAALNQGDRVGGELFTEMGHQEYRPGRGKHSLLHMLKGLAQTSSQIAQPSHPVSLEPAFKRLRKIALAGSLVIIISDFRGFDAAAEDHLAHIRRHAELLLIQVSDPLEQALPTQGWHEVTDGSNKAAFSGGEFVIRYGQRAGNRQAVLDAFCARNHISIMRLSTDDQVMPLMQQRYGKRGGRC